MTKQCRLVYSLSETQNLIVPQQVQTLIPSSQIRMTLNGAKPGVKTMMPLLIESVVINNPEYILAWFMLKVKLKMK